MVEEHRPAAPDAALADESRRKKKEAKRLAESTRSLDAWERYRTPIDRLSPGDRQEGLAFDPEGALWIADDRRGLFKIPGALAALERGSEIGS